MEYQFLVLLHVFLAIVIIGGVWMASFIVIPFAKKTDNPSFAFNYIKAFDRGSHLVLTLQFLIGFRLAMIYLPMSEWFTFSTHISLSVVVKLVLWVALFAWMIIGKKKGMSTPETGTLKSAGTYFGILSALAFGLMLFGLNFRLGLI
ncbi:MAG: hypothetical protein JJ966_04480 [Balneolaceae bacterium]|nr:hypothetical protein [Balneolaceae bacterium]